MGCDMVPAEVRARLVSLESRWFVASRYEKQSVPPSAGLWRHAAGIVEAKMQA